jgi:hypothetical protein
VNKTTDKEAWVMPSVLLLKLLVRRNNRKILRGNSCMISLS